MLSANKKLQPSAATSNPDWLAAGWDHIWLPYTQMQGAAMPLPISSANGSILELADGRTLIDGIASWWSVCHGYRHPHIMQAVARQLEQLPHVMFGGLAHEPAYTLASRLAAIAPQGLSRVFFSDSGSTTVEIAMKMAVQYWSNQGADKKKHFVSFRHGYHGDTMGAMSLSDPDDWIHKTLNHYVPKQFCIPVPETDQDVARMDTFLDQHQADIAAIIIEPLVQAAGGFKFHSPEILDTIYAAAQQKNILFIADEIAVGFGRTGTLFACNAANITPDILCLGKALTGGTMTLAATLATDKIFDAFLSDAPETALMHGPTYMANPLACAAANASLDLFEFEERLPQVAAIEAQLQRELGTVGNIQNVKDVRVKGAIGVVELKESTPKLIHKLRLNFIDKGVWIRPFDKVVYVMPPLVITPQELSTLTRSITSVLTEI